MPTVPRLAAALAVTLSSLLASALAFASPARANDASSQLELLTTYAPRVWLAPGEEYFPASVDWAAPYLERYRHDDGQYWIRTRQGLDSPSDDSLPLFAGHLDSAPAYAFWVDKGEAVDLVYFFYYPYNRGKSILNTIWGNHVGDWEHITVRLTRQRDTGAWTPSQAYISAHDFGGAYPWEEITKQGTHPVVYSAKGSHGLWKDPGNHTYKDLGLLGDLVDHCGQGTAWDTWERLAAFDFGTKTGLSDTPWPAWMEDDFKLPGQGDPADPLSGPIYRWGNTKEGCGAEVVSGECRLNNGPTGPISKGVWDDASFE